jgi:uncharacterized Ntn-hydrolase superfamily protein
MSFVVRIVTLLWLAQFLALAVCSRAQASDPLISTFSIVAFDPATGDFGVAVQSKYFAVGDVVPFARADTGALATQARGNLLYGPQGLAMLAEGQSAEQVIEMLTAKDPLREERQVGVVDREGRAATYTGKRCLPWAGGRTGEHYTVQGNLLTGPQVVEAMSAAFEATEGDLADRLVYALAAGQAAGGDARGRQSAAVLVVREGAGYLGLTDRYIDLHVEDHPTPVRELKRLLDIRHAQLAGGLAEGLLARAAQAQPEQRAVLLAEARGAVDRALVLHGSDSGYWWLSARLYLADGDLAAAASAGREALLRNPAWARLPPQTRSALGLTPELLDSLRSNPGFERLWESLATGAAVP